jgi:hypothetical protein
MLRPAGAGGSNIKLPNNGKDRLRGLNGHVNGHSKRRDQSERTITEIRLRDDTQPSDFLVPLPATKQAIIKGCICPPQPEWPTIFIASDCPLHCGHDGG